MNIQDKVAVITGASAGIGLAIAKELSKRGAKVVLAARSADKLASISAEISGSLSITTDMTKPDDIKKLVSETAQKFGRIDILINNAGQGLYAPVEKIDLKEYESIMNLNVFSVVRAMQEVIPVMRKQKEGVILNISSMVSKNYYPYLAAYSSTKYALNAISLTARQELEDDGIVVSVFHPRLTKTEFGANALGANGGRSQIDTSGMVSDTPEEVAVRVADQIVSETAEEGMEM